MTPFVSGSLRAAALWMAAFGLFCATLLPASVMPLRAADAAMRLVLCTGNGPVVLMTADKPLAPGAGEGRCKWACCHALATGCDRAAAAPRPIPAGRLSRLAPPPQILRTARVTGLPPATGPPSTRLS
ncbi:hypothetical protein FBT96_06060 [Rhodobacter capsulatus]|uniref:DUF2946 domain-containing protein n=1 Tax=Rhodobacter capsulatus TaxID=1061 RepID=A0A4U1JTP1_RHOCA|nr:hypothetical protein [Rhodobacter capsulatus]TKD22681.1 hypothetical protein FBT96_06060 [Rhodobacter capsulatus]